MTANTKQDLEDFKKTLAEEHKTQLERIIADKGEDYAISVLGHLKEQVEYLKSL